MKRVTLLAALAAALLAAQQAAPKKDHSLGYDDTPMLPGQPWRVHDISRPHPRMVTPGATPGAPPSDALVLFDGKDLSHWLVKIKGEVQEPKWKVENGYVEVVPGTGSIYTKEKFGDCQLHVEWAAPAEIKNKGQLRGNSGIILMSSYEMQVLDSWDNPTYADGQAGAIYGQWPPLVNAARKPGEWQAYDIIFEAPHFADGKLARPGYVTILHNGIVVQHHQQILGHVVHAKLPQYVPHGPEEPLMLQNHGTAVRYRNIWIRRLAGYDQP